MMNRHDVTVWTQILNPDGSVMWADRMQWHGVDDDIVAWLANSCRITAGQLVAYPETVGRGYTIQYRTLVEGPAPSDTTMLDFERVDYEGMVRFRRWALHELGEMLGELERKEVAPALPAKPRNRVLAALGLLWQWLRVRLSINRPAAMVGRKEAP